MSALNRRFALAGLAALPATAARSIMGGRGPGGHNSKGKLRDVQCARLDVQELAREGNLKLGSRGLLFGTICFEVAGGPDAQRLVLEFPCRSARGEPVRQVICCYWRKAHYGGRYLMFLCSECHRPVRVLYAPNSGQQHRAWLFSCRKCAGITYQSAMESGPELWAIVAPCPVQPSDVGPPWPEALLQPAHLSCSLPLLAFARFLHEGRVIFFGSRLTHSRSPCAPQMPGGKRVTLNISSALASA